MVEVINILFHKKKKRVFVNFFSSSREHLLIFINCVQMNASLSLQVVPARGKFYSMHRIPGLQYEFYFKNVYGVLAASPVYILSILLSLSLSFIVYCVISNISIFIFLYKNTFQLRKQNLPRMETVIKFHAGPLACSLVIYSCLPRLKHIQTNRTFFSSSS